MESLPGGINTVITQEYADCGVGISGGQGQKIAVARALYHGSDFLILDEPASSMDPVSEYEFNDLISTNTLILSSAIPRLSASSSLSIWSNNRND